MQPCAVQYASAFDEEVIEQKIDEIVGPLNEESDGSDDPAAEVMTFESGSPKDEVGSVGEQQEDVQHEVEASEDGESIVESEVSVSDLVIPDVGYKSEVVENHRRNSNKPTDVFYFYQGM